MRAISGYGAVKGNKRRCSRTPVNYAPTQWGEGTAASDWKGSVEAWPQGTGSNPTPRLSLVIGTDIGSWRALGDTALWRVANGLVSLGVLGWNQESLAVMGARQNHSLPQKRQLRHGGEIHRSRNFYSAPGWPCNLRQGRSQLWPSDPLSPQEA